jgi:hypothetical protein
VTINSLIQLSLANVLTRYSGERHVVYGSVLSGRSHQIFGIDKMVGLLLNTLPMAVEIHGNQSVEEHLVQMHNKVQEVNHYSYRNLFFTNGVSQWKKEDAEFIAIGRDLVSMQVRHEVAQYSAMRGGNPPKPCPRPSALYARLHAVQRTGHLSEMSYKTIR